MRRWMWLAIILFIGGCGVVHAEDFPAFQNRGAVRLSTMVAIAVTTTPALILSTGSNVFNRWNNQSSTYSSAGTGTSGAGLFVWPSTAGIFGSTNTANPVLLGQYMRERIYMEIYNDGGQDIWIGYDSNISTVAGANYGRRIPNGAALSWDGAIQNIWAKAGVATTTTVVITQQR